MLKGAPPYAMISDKRGGHHTKEGQGGVAASLGARPKPRHLPRIYKVKERSRPGSDGNKGGREDVNNRSQHV